jgi:hypothetical protein
VGGIVLIVLAVFAARRVWLGYPATGAEFAVLAPREEAFLQAAAEALFPPHADLPVSGGQADLPGYADRYLAVLPRRQRTLIRALFALFEHATLLWPGKGRGGFKRFSALSPEQRLGVLRDWQSSSLALRRLCLTALKAILILGYVGHPESLAALELAPWKIDSPRVEADFLYPPIGGHRDQISRVGEPLETAPTAPPLVPGLDQEAP